MAITINPEIQGQETSSTCTYCYMYEPLRLSILESDLSATKLYIDLEIIDTTNSSNTITIETEFLNYDIIGGIRVSVDLMKLVRQYHDANVFSFATVNDIVSGWQSVVSKYKYKFDIYTDITTTPISVIKLPLIGGRTFKNFTPLVDSSISTNEFDFFNLNKTNVWKNYPLINTNLVSASATNSTPTITVTNQTLGKEPCGGYLIWKSRLGGWMSWGFNIKIETPNHSYSGNLKSDFFESNQEFNGSPYIPIDYTSVSTDYNYNLKAIGLTQDELIVCNSISGATVIYFVHENGSLELMRMTSFSAPITSLNSGGDFNVSLKSISSTTQNTL